MSPSKRNLPTMKLALRSALVLVVALSGCKTTQSANDAKLGGPVSGGEGAQTGAESQISGRAKLLFEDALKDLEKQKKAGAMDYAGLTRRFQAAADADPNFGEPVYNQGVLAERQGKIQEAFAFYKEALRRKPTLRQASENMAVILQNSGKEDQAVEVYKNILESYPDDGSSRARLAEIYRRRGDGARALELAREALFREPKTLTAYKVMMRVYYEQRQLSLAKLVALRALKLDENDAEIYHTLGLICLEEKEPAKARVQFKRAVAARADYLPSQLELAKMALAQENYAGAEESLRRILQANGKNAAAHVDLGVAYKGMGQLDKAMAEYDEAQKLDANLPSIYLNRGIIIALKGDPVKAIEYYKQYISVGGGVSGEHPVHELIREAEAEIQRREDEKRALEEAKRMEAEMAKQMAEQEALEKKQKEEELKKAQQDAKKGASSDAAEGADAANAEKQQCLEQAQNAAQKKECEKIGAPEPKKAPAPPKAEPAKAPAAKKPAPAAPAGEPGEPGEPLEP